MTARDRITQTVKVRRNARERHSGRRSFLPDLRGWPQRSSGCDRSLYCELRSEDKGARKRTALNAFSLNTQES